MTEDTPKKKLKLVAMVDWVITILFLGYGIYSVVTQWPNPDILAWISLALGVVGIPLTLFNPVARINTWVLRRLVKR